MVSEMRLKRLSELVRQRAAQAILFELKDPRLGFLTVSRVKLVRDLSHCTIYWSIVGTPGDRSKTEHALKNSVGYVQGVVAKAMGTRVTPRIAFEFDPSFEKAQKIHEILHRLKEERGEEDEEAGDGDGEADGEADGDDDGDQAEQAPPEAP